MGGIVVALLAAMGLVLLPLRAAAATVPMLIAYDVAVPPMTTMLVERPDTVQREVEPASNDYDRACVGCDDPWNPPVAAGAADIHAYDDTFELLEQRERAKGAIYGAVVATPELEEAVATRRLATTGDTQFPTQADALAEALERHGIDPSTVETTPMYGQNPNLIGPQGQPWEMVRGLNSDGELIEFENHANGHYFDDTDEFELPHYHGPDGEHLTY